MERQGVHVTRNRPDLLWAVQNFNFYNLNNSGMTGESLMGNLTDSQMLGSLGMADEHLENLHGMFRSKAMAPIHRPHGEADVHSLTHTPTPRTYAAAAAASTSDLFLFRWCGPSWNLKR